MKFNYYSLRCTWNFATFMMEPYILVEHENFAKMEPNPDYVKWEKEYE